MTTFNRILEALTARKAPAHKVDDESGGGLHEIITNHAKVSADIALLSRHMF